MKAPASIALWIELLKVVVDARPFHYAIGNMAGFYFPVYGYRQVGYRAVLDVVIALAVPHKITARFM